MTLLFHPLKCFLPAVALLALSSCRDDNHISRLQDEIRSLSDQQGQARSELSRMKMQLNSMEKERDSLKLEKTKLEADLEAARKTLEQLQKDFASYRSQYKISMRTRAPGMSLGELLVDGKSYQNVTVREATEDLLMVIHDSGTQKFSWNALPDTVRRLFGMEKPGEFVMISFADANTKIRPLSTEDKIARHDAEMLELQRKIRELQTELTTLESSASDNGRALSDASRKQLDTVNLERARNAYAVKRTQLDSEIERLEKAQNNLMKQDPRRKRF